MSTTEYLTTYHHLIYDYDYMESWRLDVGVGRWTVEALDNRYYGYQYHSPFGKYVW